MRQRIMWVLFLYLGGAAFTSAQTVSTIPSIKTIIASMALARARIRHVFVHTSSLATTSCLGRKEQTQGPR